jgi:hypothetical protein
MNLASVLVKCVGTNPKSIHGHAEEFSIYSTSWYALGNHHCHTAQVAVSPLTVVAVIVQSHGVTQVTNQFVSTVAIVVSSLLQVIDLSHMLGSIVAISCSVCHTVVRVIEFLSKTILVGDGIPI